MLLAHINDPAIQIQMQEKLKHLPKMILLLHILLVIYLVCTHVNFVTPAFCSWFVPHFTQFTLEFYCTGDRLTISQNVMHFLDLSMIKIIIKWKIHAFNISGLYKFTKVIKGFSK